MEVDTATSFLVISERIYEKFVLEKSALSLEKTGIVLRSYTGEEINPKGSCIDNESYEGRKLNKNRTIQLVQYSELVTLIVSVMKNDKTVTIWGDYKRTVSKVSERMVTLFQKKLVWWPVHKVS